MNLSTSNSKTGFIIISVLSFVVFAALYSIAAPRLFPEGGDIQNQWQGNVFIADEFLQGDAVAKKVIAGTSLSLRLRRGGFEGSPFILAFNGGSALTALRLILDSRKFPDEVFIETNLLLTKEEDRALTRALLSPAGRAAKGAFPVLQEKYQPVSIFLKSFKDISGVARADFFSADNVDRPTYERLLKEESARLSVAPNRQTLEANLRSLRLSVKALEESGVEVVFLELPMEASLYASPGLDAGREKLKKAFPTRRYRWIRTDWSGYKTTDGLHLDSQSASKFNAFLMGKMD